MSQRIPETPEDVTPEWLTAVLTEAGVLRAGRVIAGPWERVGVEYGFTGLVGRVELRYQDEWGTPPSSLVVKLPMAKCDTVSGHRAVQERDSALMRRYYERCVRELRFYREIGVSFAPRMYYSAADEAQQRVVLLLEDLSDGRQGDVLEGCSIEDARLVIDQLAPFHARWWGDRAPVSGFAVAGRDPTERQERYIGQHDLFVERYGDRLPPGIADVLEGLRSRLANVASALHARQKTLIHADLHLDNMLFDARGDGRSVTVLDWQTVSIGSPAWDVALFLFGSLSVEDRHTAESELFDRYIGLLAAHGVRGYASEDLRLECGLAVLLVLAGTVGWLATVDRDATGRERALQDAVLGDGRLLTAVLDHASSV
ncbi:MAG: phosphotransferase [Gaiellales bacterium]